MVAEFDSFSSAIQPSAGVAAELQGRPDGQRDDTDTSARKELDAAKATADDIERRMNERHERVTQKIREQEAATEARRAEAARQELADVDEFLGALTVVANAAVSRGDLALTDQIVARASRTAARAKDDVAIVDSDIVRTTLPSEEASMKRRAALGAVAHSVAGRTRALGALAQTAATASGDPHAVAAAAESRTHLESEADAIEAAARPGPEDMVQLARSKADRGAVFNEEA